MTQNNVTPTSDPTSTSWVELIQTYGLWRFVVGVSIVVIVGGYALVSAFLSDPIGMWHQLFPPAGVINATFVGTQQVVPVSSVINPWLWLGAGVIVGVGVTLWTELISHLLRNRRT